MSRTSSSVCESIVCVCVCVCVWEGEGVYCVCGVYVLLCLFPLYIKGDCFENGRFVFFVDTSHTFALVP